jgi:type I restriction enzyme R subunit
LILGRGTVTEQETRTRLINPRLAEAGWQPDRILEERTITPGRISVAGQKGRRKSNEARRPDFILEYAEDLPIAIVEAKEAGSGTAPGMQQAKEYASLLDLKFAYSTDGHGIREFDAIVGIERELTTFPSPAELWKRLNAGATDMAEKVERHVLAPTNRTSGRPLRYYQQIAVNRVVHAVASGKPRVLLCMATGTGKSMTAFQICWKLWTSAWNKKGSLARKPRILFLADRNILIEQPYDNEFAPFGDARHKIESSRVTLGREMYFAIYQAIAENENREGLFREYPRDFFDLVIVDECHRGSARKDSSWRGILNHFEQATQLGMTATPLHEESRDTYDYFGPPVFTYSLKKGIEDGFLAPYRVRRVVTNVDATGWRPTKGQRDNFGQEIPDEEFHTKDFDSILVHEERTRAIARHLSDYLKATNRFNKTLVFCVDQDHADRMRMALNNLNKDLVRQHPDYVVRVTSDERSVGRAKLKQFQDKERETPVVLTTSEMLTTGVDAPTVHNIAIVRSVGSMATFKQTIGRGTRLAEDYGKSFFTILDYTGWATRKFADPEFDGQAEDTETDALCEQPHQDNYSSTEGVGPAGEEMVDEAVEPVDVEVYDAGSLPGSGVEDAEDRSSTDPWVISGGEEPQLRRRYVVDGDKVFIAVEVDSTLDASGNQLRVVRYTDFTREQVRTLYRNAAELRAKWASPEYREQALDELASRDIEIDDVIQDSGVDATTADPLDLLCHLAWGQPLLTRKQRVEAMKRRNPDFFFKYGAAAREVLTALVDKYAEHGIQELKLPEALQVPPLSEMGTVPDIIARFGDPASLRGAIDELNHLLYAA